MQILPDWIDRSLNDISNAELFDIYFSKTKLEEIDKEFFLENLNNGIDIVLDNALRVRSIHLYSLGYQGAKNFNGYIPHNLLFSDSQSTIRKKLGEPNSVGGGYNDSVFGYIEYWEKFFFQKYSLHIRYSVHRDMILLVTIGSLNFEKLAIAD